MKKDFDSLQKEWYQKLKDDGFYDIENSKQQLRSPSMKLAAKFNPDTEYYYTLCRRLSHDPIFMFTTSSEEQLIWEYHSEGLSAARIVEKMFNEHNLMSLTKRKKNHRMRVQRIINKLEKNYLWEMMQDEEEG